MKNRSRKLHSEETKQKMKLSAIGKNKGKVSPRKGVKLSDDTKTKISKNHSHSKPMLGKKHTEETKDKIRNKKIGKESPRRKPIINIETGVIFSHKLDAANSVGMKVRTLKAKLLGKIKNNTPFRYA